MFVRSDLVSYGNRNHTLHSNHTAAVRKNKTPNQTTKQNIPHHTTLFGLVWEVNKRLIWSPLMICNTFSLPQNRISDYFKIRVMLEILNEYQILDTKLRGILISILILNNNKSNVLGVPN